MKLIWSLTTLAISAEAFQKAPGNGSCRGPGGVNDKVNNRFADEIDEDECKAYCEAELNCNGYAHSAAINEGDCILHGPGLAGTCSDAQYDLRSSCEGAGETWTGPEAPWKGESWHSTVVAGTTDESSSSYICYELDDEDHLAQCNGDSCAFAADARVLENCPSGSGCIFVVAPEMPPLKPPHPGDIELAGWEKPLSGACRGGPEGTDKVNGLYATKDSQTQQQCADRCTALTKCTGYHHGPYCSIFGPGIDEEADETTWFATAGNYTEVTGTKANDQYICFTSVPRNADVGTSADTGSGNETDNSSSTFKFHFGLAVLSFGATISNYL